MENTRNSNGLNSKEYSNPVEAISFKIFNIFDVFRVNTALRNEDSTQIVLLFVSLYKDGIVSYETINKILNVSDFNKYILDSNLDEESKKAYLSIINVLYDSLSQVIHKSLDYLSFHLFQIEPELLAEHYPAIFDDVIYRIAKTQGRYTTEFNQPIELTRFINSLVELDTDARVFNPFAGVASFGINISDNQTYIGQEINQKTWVIGLLRLMAYEALLNANFENSDSIKKWPDESQKFDLIVSNPPFGMLIQHEEFFIERSKPCNVEDFFIARGIEGLSAKGKLIGLFSTGVLFKGGVTEKQRKYAVDNDYLEMVVSLPSNLLYGTAISTTILVFAKNKKLRGNIKFVDGTSFYEKEGRVNVLLSDKLLTSIENNDSQFVHFVSTEEIIENDYNLSVNRYFSESLDKITIPNGFELVKLAEIATVVRGERNNDTIGRNVKISDLKSDSFNYKIKSSDFEITSMSSVYQKISSNVMLLSKINALKPTYCFVFENESIYINNNIVAFNVDTTKVDVSYLILELNSERIQQFIASRFAGVTIPTISIKDMLEIPIILPPLEQQLKFVDEALKEYQKEKIEELGLKIEDLTDSKRDIFEKNMHLRKHALEQVLNRFTPGFSSLKKCMEHNGGKLFSDMIVNSYNGDTVSTSFEKLENLVTKLELLVDRLVDEQTYGEPEEIWIETFLEDYEKNHNATNYPVRFVHQREKAETDIVFDGEVYARMGDELSSYSIRFCPKDLTQILENIIANANKYGFNDMSRNDYEVQISLEEIKDNIVIKVANNGTPLHSSMTPEKLFTWGGGDGTGLGLWQVRNIVEHFKGTVEAKIYKDTFPFEIRISLPITNRL